jgi:hypothetical protein
MLVVAKEAGGFYDKDESSRCQSIQRGMVIASI